MQSCSTAAAASRAASFTPFRPHASSRRALQICAVQKQEQAQPQQQQQSSRREFVLNGVNVAVVGALFNLGTQLSPRPSTLGIQSYGPQVRTLGLCPPTPNCISTAEEMNDPGHFVAPWTYNPQDGRGSRKPASQEKAMQELVDVVSSLKPDGYSPTIVRRDDEYVYVEYTSPVLGFIDDVEFYFPKGDRSLVEYRSASRFGSSDGNKNRKRIKALRQALEKKGWQSTAGY